MRLHVLLFSALALLAGGFAHAATSPVTIVQWDFEDADYQEKTDILPSSATMEAVRVSSLIEMGGENKIGVVKKARGAKALGGSVFSRCLEIDMKAVSHGKLNAERYSLNFSVTAKEGRMLTLTSLSLDLGYDTSLERYFAPLAQVYVSLDQKKWKAVGDVLTPNIGRMADSFKDAYFVDTGKTVSLEKVGELKAGQTVYFRISLGKKGEANSNQRRIIVDNIILRGSLLE